MDGCTMAKGIQAGPAACLFCAAKVSVFLDFQEEIYKSKRGIALKSQI
jgi:hypothetical protein